MVSPHRLVPQSIQVPTDWQHATVVSHDVSAPLQSVGVSQHLAPASIAFKMLPIHSITAGFYNSFTFLKDWLYDILTIGCVPGHFITTLEPILLKSAANVVPNICTNLLGRAKAPKCALPWPNQAQGDEASKKKTGQ